MLASGRSPRRQALRPLPQQRQSGSDEPGGAPRIRLCPDRFTRELGFHHIIDVHRHLSFTDEQRERFVALYMEALDEAGMPEDEPFRQAVREHVEFGARVAQQNSWAETDAELHPVRAVPRWQWPT